MSIRIGCVVEGQGEVESVPILVRRIAEQLDPGLSVSIPKPVRVTKGKLLKPQELERAVGLAALNAGPMGGILVFLDSDGDCPAQLGSSLLERVCRARGDLISAVVIAKREFESWFLASAESLRGKRGLLLNIESPIQPEEIPGAKEWLSRRTTDGAYASTVDQASLMHALDFELARRAPSFDRCFRKVTSMLETLRSRG